MISSVKYLFLLLLLPGIAMQQKSLRVISGSGVFVFGPSLAEADTIHPDYAGALDDFAYYSSRIAASARAHGIKSEYISTRRIKVQYSSVRTFIIDRDTVDFGTILTDGKKAPILLKYVHTDVDFDREFKRYFQSK